MLQNIGKVLLSIAAVQYGVIPLIIDLSESHLFHSDWTAHSRFHLAWLLAVGLLVCTYVLACVWIAADKNWIWIKSASVIGALYLLAFFCAAILIPAYSGALSDLAQPIVVFGIDGNVFSFSIALVLQAAGMALVWIAPNASVA